MAASGFSSLLTYSSSSSLRHRAFPLLYLSPPIRPFTKMGSRHSSLEVCGGGADAYLPALKSLDNGYTPYPFIGWNRHVETIFASFFRTRPDVKLKRECLRTKDGGAVSLDWVVGDDRSLPEDSPLLILLPGLTGGSQDSYVRHMLVRARSNGWRVVVFNSRGCGGSPVTTSQAYKSYIFLILISLLLQESDSCPLSGAVSLCNPFNLVIADEDFRKGFNNVYDKSLANALVKIFKKHALLFSDMGGEYNIELAASAKTVKDFDEGLTRVSFGFKSADDYYSKSSSSDSIKYVKRPLLCIQAGNDPIAPSRGIPRDDIKENPNCLLIVTPQGGHLGWVAGSEAPRGAPWTDPTVLDFLIHLQKGTSKHINGIELDRSEQYADLL
uniref:AB hydrolase-1 domain-containing protein n=1 Tax=Kalanchoe fedtschenkoi TaxID=63787 RepID=A0A7N0UKA8_KALFE